MREPLVSMAMPALAAHLSDVRFHYSYNKYYSLCGQMGHLIGPSGIGKAQLTHIIEDIMRYFCAGLAQRYHGGPMVDATASASCDRTAIL